MDAEDRRRQKQSTIAIHILIYAFLVGFAHLVYRWLLADEGVCRLILRSFFPEEILRSVCHEAVVLELGVLLALDGVQAGFVFEGGGLGVDEVL